RQLRAAFGGGLRPALTGDAPCAWVSGRRGRRNGAFSRTKKHPFLVRGGSPILSPGRSPGKGANRIDGTKVRTGSGHSVVSSRLRARRNAWNPIRATHRGQRPVSRRSNRPNT